jgi:uncharacterized membrane protein
MIGYTNMEVHMRRYKMISMLVASTISTLLVGYGYTHKLISFGTFFALVFIMAAAIGILHSFIEDRN